MQKIAALFAILVASLAAPALAQSADEAAVARGMEALAKAIVAVDKAQLENLAWPELSYGHSAGRVENKAQYVDALVSKKSIVTKIDYSKMTTSIVGDIALVRGQMMFMVESTGKPVPTDLHFLMVWQKRGGEWKLLARQAYKA
jgi:hypothetical protein